MPLHVCYRSSYSTCPPAPCMRHASIVLVPGRTFGVQKRAGVALRCFTTVHVGRSGVRRRRGGEGGTGRLYAQVVPTGYGASHIECSPGAQVSNIQCVCVSPGDNACGRGVAVPCRARVPPPDYAARSEVASSVCLPGDRSALCFDARRAG
jgi:hypothetical protein